nr:uncharacterized protein LOC109155151 [Ipomoea batatas]
MVKVVVVDNHKGLHYVVDTRMEVFLYVEDVDPLDLWIYLQKLNGTKVLTSFLWRVCSCDELVLLLDCSFSANDPTLKGENGFKMGYLLRLEKMLHLSLVHVSRSDYATGTAAETPADVLEKIEKEKDDEVDLTDEGHVRNGMREKEKKKLIKLSHLFTHLLKSIKAKNKLVTGKVGGAAAKVAGVSPLLAVASNHALSRRCRTRGEGNLSSSCTVAKSK